LDSDAATTALSTIASSMTVYLGAGWKLTHVTDRVIEIQKDDWAYRRLTGRDGYVRVRAEPGMDRQALISRAVDCAKRQDEILGTLLAMRLAPPRRSYEMQQRRLAPAFATPEEPEIIGRKHG